MRDDILSLADPLKEANDPSSPVVRFDAATPLVMDCGEIIQIDRYLIVFGAEDALEHFQGAAEQRFGFVVSPEGVHDRRERSLVRRDVWMVGAERLFADGDRLQAGPGARPAGVGAGAVAHESLGSGGIGQTR